MSADGSPATPHVLFSSQELWLPRPATLAFSQPLLASDGTPLVTSPRVALAGPGAVSIQLPRLRLKTRSYRFACGDDKPDQFAAPAKEAAAVAPDQSEVDTPAKPLVRPTRIAPPNDVIKLEDRLFYLLQPPLESVLASRSLDFPFHPFPYQLQGVAFLYPRYSAMLADEMGLGKTMQAITTVRLLLHAGEVRRVLLICPKPLVTNWLREFATWAPEIPVMAIEGDAQRRRWQWQTIDAPLRIANYELLPRDHEWIADESNPYDLVILDESQRIKNKGSTTAELVRGIPRRRSWALTGTPVENSAEDLVGIFEFLAPGYLRSDMKPRRLGQLAADYVLRRTKDQVLDDLPPKMFRDADVELSPAQRETYRMAEEEGVLRLTHMGESATIQHVFELVLRLKQICNFDPATGESAKLERLAADLEEVAESGRKAIVFSQWVETLEALNQELGRFGTLQYHGRIPQRARDGVLQQFREDPRKHVLLMSYGAGSVGLNLQFASYVFLFDRWWNPAVEDQAINRAHRIGAAGPVTVCRFLTLNTIEQRIDQVLQEKRELFDTIFSDTSAGHSAGLTHAEIFGLFQLKCPTGPIRMAG
ncbi:MAG: DEAD/DEAH box helicase [Planctomycetes bacterium]|nr:DEAD/DEAH box helicase [Planctomycetota bacterium]